MGPSEQTNWIAERLNGRSGTKWGPPVGSCYLKKNINYIVGYYIYRYHKPELLKLSAAT